MRKSVFVVDPPTEETAGDYLLIVSRAAGMFGSSVTAFAVDSLQFSERRHFSIRAFRGADMVVEFSPDASYIMIARKSVRPTTVLDIEIEDRRESLENQKKLEVEFPPEKQGAIEVTEDGRQRINTQGYL